MEREAGVSNRDASSSPRPLPARRTPRAELAAAYTAPPLSISSGQGAMPGPISPDELEAYVEIVLGSDDATAEAFVGRLRARGVGTSDLYLSLLAPTAHRLGEMWDDDACDFFDVTVATGRLQRAVRELGHDFGPSSPVDGGGGRVLLSAMPGEQHTLGLLMVAEYLLRDGWGVRVATPATSAELAGVMRDNEFDVVGFSTACDSRLLALRHEIAAVRRHSRNSRVCVLVGGRIFVEHPDLVDRVGADGSAASAADASRCARALVDARRE